MNPDGTVSLVEGSTDIGGTRTSVAMQLAETLGIAAEAVLPRVADTDGVGYTDVTGGSRVTFATGLAAYEVGLDIRRQMAQRAALLWDCDPASVEFADGVFRSNGKSMAFRELAEKLSNTGGAIVGRAMVDSEGPTNGFGTHIVDVEVDPDTGKVTILRYTAVQDVGRAIHPSYVEGQMQGGSVQGIGWRSTRNMCSTCRAGCKTQITSTTGCRRRLDLPMIDTIIVEVPNPAHPYGVRGVGETPIVAPPAAIANAIYHATGLRMQELPISPPRLWAAIAASKAPESHGMQFDSSCGFSLSVVPPRREFSLRWPRYLSPSSGAT